jgi:hypothetical protein
MKFLPSPFIEIMNFLDESHMFEFSILIFVSIDGKHINFQMDERLGQYRERR